MKILVWTVGVALALGSAHAAAPKRPVAAALPKLTVINWDGMSGSSCAIYLDSKQKKFAGGMNYEEGLWHLGVDGRTYLIRDKNKGAMRSTDGAISVQIKSGAVVWESNDPDYPAQTTKSTVTITRGKAQSSTVVWQHCGDG